MSFEQWKPIFEDLRYAQHIDKINFAGGEPLLYKDLLKCCKYCKSIGFTVSIVSNGSLITEEFLREASDCIDWIGLSVDSTDDEIECDIGRCDSKHESNHIRNVIRVSRLAHSFGIKVKLNITVVNQSYQQDFSGIIRLVNPERVKVFQVMKLEGQNGDVFDKYAVTKEQFDQFIRRHEKIELSNGQKLVFENADIIVDSYLMLDPQGNIMRNTNNEFKTESYESITKKGIDKSLDLSKYIRRGGIYEWDSSDGSNPVYNESLPRSTRIGVFGITRSGKDFGIRNAISHIAEITGMGLIHYPYISTIRDMCKEVLFKNFEETTQIEKGMLMVRYREMLSDRTKHPFVITDEHYSYPTTYGGKCLHNAYTDAKFPFVIRMNNDNSQSYEVMFSDDYIDMYDLVFYLDTDSEEILRRIKISKPPKYNPFITLIDIRRWKEFEKISLNELCARHKIPFVVVPNDTVLSANIIDWINSFGKKDRVKNFWETNCEQ